MLSSRITALLSSFKTPEPINQDLHTIYLSVIDLLQLYEETLDWKYLSDAATLVSRLEIIFNMQPKALIKNVLIDGNMYLTKQVSSKDATWDQIFLEEVSTIPDEYYTTIAKLLHETTPGI